MKSAFKANLVLHQALLLLAISFTGTVYSIVNPTMRIHFGASRAILRLQGGVYAPMSPLKSENGKFSDRFTSSGIHLNGEALFMVNNRRRMEESLHHSAGKFIILKSAYDGSRMINLNSISFGHSLNCVNYLPVLGQIKGYWSIGAASYTRQLILDNTQMIRTEYGGRIGFNCYNKNSAIQAEISGFEHQILTNILLFGKLGKHLIAQAGVEMNHPNAGISLLFESVRITLAGRMVKNQTQYGINMTANF